MSGDAEPSGPLSAAWTSQGPPPPRAKEQNSGSSSARPTESAKSPTAEHAPDHTASPAETAFDSPALPLAGSNVDARSSQIDLIVLKVAARLSAGQGIDIEQLVGEHPDLSPDLRLALELQELTHRQFLAARRAGPIATPLPAEESLTVTDDLKSAPQPAPPTETSSEAGIEAPGEVKPSSGSRTLRDPAFVIGKAAKAEPRELAIEGYRVVEELSRGGQAIVYRAVHLATGRMIALKVMAGGWLLSHDRQARLEREASILATLQHPNIVGVIDRGRTSDGSFYLAMDFVDGMDLGQWVAQLDWDEPRGAIFAIVQMFIAIGEALGEAHRQEVVHRDVKPSNIRIDRRNEPHLLDFGLARLLSDDLVTGEATVTITGQLVGSLPWISPEQAAGDNRAVDVRSDVYMLGVALYEALANRPPYRRDGTLHEYLGRVKEEVPLPPSHWRHEVSDRLDGAVLKALSKDPADRFPDALSFAQDLRVATAIGLTVENSRAGAGAELESSEPVSTEDLASLEPAATSVAASAAEARRAAWKRWGPLGALALLLAAGFAVFMTSRQGSQRANSIPAIPVLPPLAATTQAAKKRANITLLALQDAWVQGGDATADTHFGDESGRNRQNFTKLFVSRLGNISDTRDAYIQFDLSTVAGDCTIARATLKLHGACQAAVGKSKKASPERLSIAAYALADEEAVWNEKTLSWKTRPFMRGTGKPDGPLATTNVPLNVLSWWDVNLTEYLNAERAIGHRKVTIGLHTAVGGRAIARFDSSESAFGPKLEIETVEN